MEQATVTYLTQTNKPMRLDQYLFDTYPDYSRSYFQKLIEQGTVLINNKQVLKPSYKLKKNDTVHVSFAKTHEYSLAPQAMDLKILFVHDDFVIVNKPAGLLVHPASTTKPDEPTLVGGLLHYFTELSSFDDDQRPGIVHRLDKDTSGVIIIARTPQAQIAFSNMFKDRKMSKTYLAIVRGEPEKTGTIDYPIGRHPNLRHKMSHVGVASRDALTHYRTLTYFEGYALVEASPVTGRTHQIRVHFAAIGHGLMGDTVYGFQSKLISRQALHAYELKFTYKGESFSFSAPIPEDFEPFLTEKEST